MSAESLIVDYEPPAGAPGTPPSSLVFGSCGHRIGRILARIRPPGETDESFYLLSLGSAPRIGDDRRVVPASLVVVVEAGQRLQCLVEADLVRRAPVYVECSRCHCGDWLERVRRHFEAARPPLPRPS